MKASYDVYAVGNALVDMVFEVSVELLDRLGIQKGVMTLMDLSRKEQLLEELRHIPCQMACGGSAANTVIAVAQMGGNGFYSCKVAGDEAGSFYISNLRQAGVDGLDRFICNTRSDDIDGVTGKCLVFVTPDADRTMNTYLGITSTLGVEQLSREHLQRAKYCYVEGYMATSPSGRAAALQTFQWARQQQVRTALTFSDLSMVSYFGTELRQMLGDGVDLLFCNESEALAFAQTTDLMQAGSYLQQKAQQFVITLGARGAMLFDGKNYHQVKAQQVQAVDTNGAGDMFAGAFLYGLTHGYSFAQSGELASRASGQVVTQFGPRLQAVETQKVLQEFLASVKERA